MARNEMGNCRWEGVAYALAAVVGMACVLPGARGEIGVSVGVPATGPRAATTQPSSVQPGGLMDRAAATGSQIYVDDSFAAVEKLRTAAHYASQGQSQLAIQTYQEILNTFGTKLVYLQDDSYVSITDFVRGKLLALPAVQNGMYDQLFGIEAKKQIDAALEQRDLPLVIRLSDQYFPSAAAFDGLSQAAEWYFERGEFAAASRTWQELLDHPLAAASGGKARATLLFRAAVAEKLGRNSPEADRLRQNLQREFPEATGTVDGQEVKLLDKLNYVFGLPGWNTSTEVANDEWPEFQGGPSRSRLLDVHSSIGAQLWAADLRDGSSVQSRSASPPTTAPSDDDQPERPRPSSSSRNSTSQRLISYPTLSQGTLFIHNGQRVIALSANAGSLLWAYPQQVPSRPMVPRYYRNRFAPNEEMNSPRPAAHESAAVDGDHVFAVLPVMAGAPTAEDEVEASGLIPSTRVVCLDRNTGHEEWSTSAASVKMETKGRLTFIGSPLVTPHGVYVMARKLGESTFVQLYLLCLDPESGSPKWSCYICSTSAGAYFGPLLTFSNIPIPTFADDTLYVTTGQGADCAVDASSGRIRWLRITDKAKKARDPAEYYNQREIEASWKFNPPLVHGDHLITCESDSGGSVIHVYNRWTGKLIRDVSGKELDDPSIDALAGVIGSNLIITGAKVTALDLGAIDQKVSVAWTCPYPEQSGSRQGRSFLAETGLYVPFQNGMLLVDPHTGKQIDFWSWPETGSDTTGKPGNFLVTAEQVVVVTDEEIDGYSKWETARDNRLAQIKLHPDDPEPYLSLAEISFRTNHFDLAEQNMKRAVELANASGALGNGAGEMLSRLYRTNLSFAEQLVEKTDEALRTRARFYYEQCRATARTPEQQAEWRLSMSDLSLFQHKPEEAAMLYNEVLTDPALRATAYHRGDAISRAGVTAELRFRTLIDRQGEQIYKQFEDQSAALLAKGRSQHDPAVLQQVVDSYPNSKSAVAAAMDLVDSYGDRQDWLAELKVLRWLYPHATPDLKPRVTAELALAHVGLKRYEAALRWADRGLHQYKQWTGTNPLTHQEFTFASLLEQIRKDGAAVGEGRRPELPPPQHDADGHPAPPRMDESSISKPLAIGSLMVPIEQSPALRRPDLLFVLNQSKVHIYHTADSKEIAGPDGVELPENAPAALLGSQGDVSVIVQPHDAVGINTNTGAIVWKIPFVLSEEQQRRENEMAQQARGFQRVQFGGPRIVIQGGGRLIINGNVVQANDPDIAPFTIAGTVDPETSRQYSFARLGRPAFSTMRIIDGRLIVISGGAMTSYDLATGKPTWKDSNGEPLSVKTTGGFSSIIAGNEDLVVAQVESPDRFSSSFLVYDAETGKFRKQIKLESEHALWRTVSDDGTLFVVTDQAVEAYDLFSDRDQPLWRRSDIQSRFPYATSLTLDGLILINANNEIMCLSAEGGEALWPVSGSPPMPLDLPQGNLPYVRASVDGDVAVYQSPGGVVAYHTEKQENPGDQEYWPAVFNGSTDEPPIQGFQFSDRYVVVLSSGPSSGLQRSVRLQLLQEKGGLLIMSRPITNDPNGSSAGEGPAIRAWEVVDSGVAMEIGGSVHFYHAQR